VNFDFYIGDTLEYVVDEDSDYPEATWTYNLALRGPQTINLIGSLVDSEIMFDAQGATTANWKKGRYTAVFYVSLGNDRAVLDEGEIVALANPLDIVTGSDQRSHNQIMLDAIEARLENRATTDQESLSIGSQSLVRIPFSELVNWHAYYSRKIAADKRDNPITAVHYRFV